jgi:quercetin dioxygenase-like cupin family protein
LLRKEEGEMPYINLSDLEIKEPFPGFRGYFVHTENMTFAYWTVKAESSLSAHTHEHEQVVNVTDGEFELTIDGKKKILKPGEVAVVPSNAHHAGRAITDCKIIDVFYPIREDYR